MGFYAIIGMEMDKNIKDVTKRYMVNDVLARKDAIKTMTYSSSKIQCEELCCTWLCCEKKLFRGRLRNWFSSIHQILHKKGRKILFDLPFQKPFLAFRFREADPRNCFHFINIPNSQYLYEYLPILFVVS